MTRNIRREEKTVTRTVDVVDITCDKCGRRIDPDVLEGPATGHEIAMSLDPEECVNFYRHRDYCDVCYAPIWEGMNKLIGADPDVEREDRDLE